MDYRVDVDFLEHPKTIHLLELAGSDGLTWLLRLWAYTAKFRADGVLSGLNAARIESALRFAYESQETIETTNPERVEKLVESGWLIYNEKIKTYEVSGWKEYQSWVIGAKQRSESAKKAAKAKWDKKSLKNTTDAPRIDSALRPAEHSQDAVVDAPSPSPFPSPKRNKSKPADAGIPVAEIIGNLNRLTGKNFKLTSKMAIRNITARWNEGYRLDDFKHVNQVKVEEWLGTDMAKHLNPETLYGNHFEKYRNQTPSGPPLSRDQEEFQRSIDVGNRAVARTKRELAETFGTGTGSGAGG